MKYTLTILYTTGSLQWVVNYFCQGKEMKTENPVAHHLLLQKEGGETQGNFRTTASTEGEGIVSPQFFLPFFHPQELSICS